MAADVDWVEIRRAWETTDVSDAALAKAYGFASKTTIVRRRMAEAWRRNPVEVTANLATRAAVGSELAAEAEAARGHNPDTAAGDRKTQQDQARETPSLTSVTRRSARDTVIEAFADTPSGARDVPAVIEARPIGDRVEELSELRAQSTRRTLAAAEAMRKAALAGVQNVGAILAGPMIGGLEEDPESPQTPFGMAVISLRAVNADRETMAGLLKACMDLLDRANRMEREALGMNQPAGQASDGPAAATGVMSMEQFAAIAAQRADLLDGLIDLTRDLKISSME